IQFFSFPGGQSEGVTPVPIPNTDVKPLSADGTAWATAWESRTLPGLFFEGPAVRRAFCFSVDETFRFRGARSSRESPRRERSVTPHFVLTELRSPQYKDASIDVFG